MYSAKTPMRAVTSLLVILLCFSIGCSESGRQRAGQIDPLLTEAGFRATPADTVDRREALSTVTPFKVQYFKYRGRHLFFVADPDVCHCVYVGDEADYLRLRQLKREHPELLDEETEQQAYLQFLTTPANQALIGE